MRASTDQVRTATLDAVDAARSRATGLVHHGADLVGTTIERGASTLEDGVERVSDKVPSGAVTVAGAAFTAAEPVRHRLRTLLIALVVVTVGIVVARKLMGASPSDDDERSTDPVPSNHNGDQPSTAPDPAAAAAGG